MGCIITFNICFNTKIGQCNEGDTTIPQKLKDGYPGMTKFPKEKEEAQRIWAQKDKQVTNFSATASSLSQNPGDHARSHLDPEVWTELMTVVPNCEAKSRLSKLYLKFKAIRDIYKARDVTENQQLEIRQLCIEFGELMISDFDFIDITSLIHQICMHLPEHFEDPRSTNSVLDMSSSLVEASNKTQRYSIKLRTFRGNVSQMMADSLQYTYLKATKKFKTSDDISNEVMDNRAKVEETEGGR